MKSKIWSLITFVVISCFCFISCYSTTKIDHVPKDNIALSEIAENLKMKIFWDPVHECVRLEREDQFIAVRPTSSQIQIGDQQKDMPTPAYKHEGEIYISKGFYQQQLAQLKPKAPKPVEVKKIETPKEQVKEVTPVEKKQEVVKAVSPKYSIVLDAGHGGKDTGAIGITGVYEKDLNFEMVELLKKILDKENIKIVQTRTDDTFISLDRRVEIANTSGADCFVSVHFNSVGFPNALGFEIWKYGQDVTTREQQSSILAKKIHTQIKNTPLRDRGVKDYKNLRVIKATTIPAVLIECGFISNPSDMDWFSRSENKEKFAELIAQGILDFLKQ